MYTINDLRTGSSTRYASILEFACAWLEICAMAMRGCIPARGRLLDCLSFRDFNPTGKDAYRVDAVVSRRICRGEDGSRTIVPVYETAYKLRRYSVTDDAGRYVDIRAWPEAVWERAAKTYDYSWILVANGARCHAHRLHGASGYLRAARAAGERPDPELAAVLTGAQLDGISVKGRDLVPGADCVDWFERRFAAKHKSSKCWKDQAKASRQYGRHRGCRRTAKPVAEDGCALAGRLSAELGIPCAAAV